MFTNPFDKEDSIMESSLFYRHFPVFQDPPFSRRYLWPPFIFFLPSSLIFPSLPFSIQRQVHPGQLFFNLFT